MPFGCITSIPDQPQKQMGYKDMQFSGDFPYQDPIIHLQQKRPTHAGHIAMVDGCIISGNAVEKNTLQVAFHWRSPLFPFH